MGVSNIKVSNQTINYIAGHISGGTGRTLLELFSKYGFNDTDIYIDGSKSKHEYTCKRLSKLNGTSVLDQVIIDYLDPRDYINTMKTNLEIAQEFNKYLFFDGYELYEENRYIKIKSFNRIQSGNIKNIIFASTGEKPEIGFEDALENNIRIFKNEDKCLVYDKNIPTDGLTFADLLDWYIEKDYTKKKGRDGFLELYSRLYKSISPKSPPEQIFFRHYYSKFSLLGESLPALLPQVYLHYDPITINQLKGQKRFAYQRMDFLMLTRGGCRIVFEMDGEEHYSENGEASPKKYAEMVSADRNLKLNGYEVYRFGGYEFLSKNSPEKMLDNFIDRLFTKHNIIKFY